VNRPLPIVFFSVLALASISCGGADQHAPEHALPTFQTRTLEVSGGDCPDADTRCAHVEARWVEAVDGTDEFRVALNEYISDRLAAGLRGIVPEDAALDDAGVSELAEVFVDSFEAFLSDFPEVGASWFHRFDAEVPVASREVVTVRTWERSYTGGAHGLERVAYASFRPESGDRVRLDDLVTSLPPLIAPAERRFREERGIAEDRSLTEAGYTFDGGVFSLPDNFGVYPEGIRFRWDAYEIAAYSTGPTEITVNWSDFSGALREDAPRP